ncbi:M48 family metallopeptidase [Halpernia frigidisoli]|uniref:Peptidase family M48 n=1 Tax=Halpernia frigidisoli TaxID=1125876 RepID=A0A1I3I120_9FLAO|nr:M48 family metallopeptidase [Halpernia frigidisoli]SFI41550.1 Peptidase family M48 [Halpernia frigidisoli]
MKIKSILGFGFIGISLWACTTNPITGRSSLHLANDQEIDAMALQEYKQTLQTGKVISGTTSATLVKTVGNRIKNAAVKYYTSLGRQGDIANYQWEFNLLQDAQLNAWCMPGGKVAVYSGILPVTKDATGLAVVLGHEISHALAGHGNERISQAMVAQYGGAILGSSISNQQVAAIFSRAYPVGAQVGLLAYGRKQELEADEMGLYLMSMAGYNPQQAPIFWERMESSSGSGNRSPEFLSTHPAPENRRADLLNDMPKALEYYRAAGGK